MDKIRNTENALVLRTDFSNDVIWKKVCKEIEKPVEDGSPSVLFNSDSLHVELPAEKFQAYVTFINDPQYKDISLKEIISLIDPDKHRFFFVVDHVTISNSELPILCVDLRENPGNMFRVVPNEMWSVENNLSICNMEFSEFAGNVDPDGIFRGFQ